MVGVPPLGNAAPIVSHVKLFFFLRGRDKLRLGALSRDRDRGFDLGSVVEKERAGALLESLESLDGRGGKLISFVSSPLSFSLLDLSGEVDTSLPPLFSAFSSTGVDVSSALLGPVPIASTLAAASGDAGWSPFVGEPGTDIFSFFI